jgi:hypothetical protein
MAEDDAGEVLPVELIAGGHAFDAGREDHAADAAGAEDAGETRAADLVLAMRKG